MVLRFPLLLPCSLLPLSTPFLDPLYLPHLSPHEKVSLLQDKIAILEAELADYKRKEEAKALEGEEEEEKKKPGFVEEAEFNDVKMKLDDAKMQLQTTDLERKQLQVSCWW